MNTWSFPAQNEADTVALGTALAGLLPASVVVTLDGPLGAGKTRFVRALAAAAGADPRAVVSPTFTLVQEYDAPQPIAHFDAYRLRSDDEFLELGFDEYLSAPLWCVIEWSARVAGCLPAERLEIQILITGETQRRFTFTALGPRLAAVLTQLAAQFGEQI